MENLESLGESAIPWMEDEFTKASTSVPEVLVEEEIAVGTLIIIIVSAIVSITLLFVMAVFIDCRHQKLAKLKEKGSSSLSKKRAFRIRIPKIVAISNRSNEEDAETFADKMQTQEPSPSQLSVIV